MGILGRFQKRYDQVKEDKAVFRAAKADIKKRERGEYLRALRTERIKAVKVKAKKDANYNFKSDMAKRLGGAVKNLQKMKAERLKQEAKGTASKGPVINTPKEGHLFTIRDFRDNK